LFGKGKYAVEIVISVVQKHCLSEAQLRQIEHSNCSLSILYESAQASEAGGGMQGI